MGATSATAQARTVATTGGCASAWLRRALPWAAWSLLLAPACIPLHELGHLLVARAVGFPHPALHANHVDWGAGADLPPAAAGLTALAGPAVSAAFALLGCAGMRRRDRIPSSAWRIAPWAALAVASASRFVVAVPYTLTNVVLRLSGSGRALAAPAFDETTAGAALGWSGDVLLASTGFLLAAVLWWVGRHLPRGERAAAWAGLLLGTALGWTVWLRAAGPWLLP